MTPTQAIAGYGAVLSWNGVAVAEVSEIGGLKISGEYKDVTSLSSASAMREQIVTLLKAENITFKANFIASDPAQQAFIADCLARTKRTVLITFPDDITFTWSVTAYIEFELSGLATDGALEFNGTLVPGGVPTISNGASTGMSALSIIEENAGASVTPVPAFAIGTFTYILDVDTASDWVKFTPTAASHTITITCGTQSEVVSSGAQSGEITLGVANTVTTITITVQESGKVAKTYTFYVRRP